MIKKMLILTLSIIRYVIIIQTLVTMATIISLAVISTLHIIPYDNISLYLTLLCIYNINYYIKPSCKDYRASNYALWRSLFLDKLAFYVSGFWSVKWGVEGAKWPFLNWIFSIVECRDGIFLYICCIQLFLHAKKDLSKMNR